MPDYTELATEMVDQVASGLVGRLQAEEVVGFYRGLVEGGLSRRLARRLTLAWLSGQDEGRGRCELDDDPDTVL